MKHPITLRIDVALLQAARHQAQTENRTLTNFVETLLKKHLADAEAPAAINLSPDKTEAPAKGVLPADGRRRTTSKRANYG